MYLSFQGQGPPPPPLLTQAHSGAAGLGLYPILWQYPNGTPTSYTPGLSLPPTAKWVHPENPVTVNSEASLRRVGIAQEMMNTQAVRFTNSSPKFSPSDQGAAIHRNAVWSWSVDTELTTESAASQNF